MNRLTKIHFRATRSSSTVVFADNMIRSLIENLRSTSQRWFYMNFDLHFFKEFYYTKRNI